MLANRFLDEGTPTWRAGPGDLTRLDTGFLPAGALIALPGAEGLPCYTALWVQDYGDLRWTMHSTTDIRRIVAFVTKGPMVQRICDYIGEPPESPNIAQHAGLLREAGQRLGRIFRLWRQAG
jgi:hypothetical protein